MSLTFILHRGSPRFFCEIAEIPAHFANISFERRLGHISAEAAMCWQALSA
jgi:hypothetical protein